MDAVRQAYRGASISALKAYYSAGRAYNEAWKALDKANRAYNEAFAAAWNTRGKSEIVQKMYDEAWAAYEEAIALAGRAYDEAVDRARKANNQRRAK